MNTWLRFFWLGSYGNRRKRRCGYYRRFLFKGGGGSGGRRPTHLVGLGAEAREALLGDVDLQRFQGLHQDVEADVKLELVDEQRPVDVLLDHALPGRGARRGLQLAGVADQVDAVALGAAVRLHDEGGTQRGVLLLHHADLRQTGGGEKVYIIYIFIVCLLQG